MRILDRYLVRHLLLPIAFCSFTLIFLTLVADLFDHLGELMKNKTSLAFILAYYLHLTPFAFVQTLPWATFLGTIFLLVNFNTHNEILAMKVAGLNISKITLPILYVGFLIGIVSFLVNDRVVPNTFRKAQEILAERIEQKSTSDTKSIPPISNFTYFSMGNRLYYAKQFNVQADKLEGLIILFYDKKKRVQRKIFAREATWQGDFWKLGNVTDYETSPTGKIRGEPKVYSEKIQEEMRESPRDFLKASSESALLSYRELKHHIRQLRENGLQPYRETVDLHYKLSGPWQSLIMISIAIPFLSVTRRRKEIALNVLYCLGLVFSFYVTGAISLAMGRAGTLSPFLGAWSNNLLFSVGSVFFLDKAND